MRKFISFLALSLISLSAYSAPLKIGVDANYPPFEFKTADGVHQGFDIELGNAICNELGRPCIWVDSSFDSIITALKAKKFDIILSALSITDKRKKIINFSDSIYNTPGYLVTKNKQIHSQQLSDLQHHRIGVIQGSVFETYANEKWRPHSVEIIAYSDSVQAYADLDAGRLDGVFDDGVVMKQELFDTDKGDHVSIVGERIYDRDIFGPGTGIGLRKDDKVLQTQINQALSKLKSNGTFDRLYQKYLPIE